MSKKVLFTIIALLLSGVLLSTIVGEYLTNGALAQLQHVEAYKWYPQQAKAIYEQIAKDYPGSDYAIKAHRNLVFSYISAKRDADAQQTLDKLTADFSGHSGLPAALYDIARIYERSRKYEKAGSIYQQIIQQYPDSSSADKAQLAAPRIGVLSHIESKDDNAAQAATDSLATDFNDHSDLPLSLYNIARRYERAKKYQKAKQLYQQIIQDYPNSSAVSKSQLGTERTSIYQLIASGEPNTTQAAIDNLVSSFAGHSDLSETLYHIAIRYERIKNYEEAKNIYQQIINQHLDTSHAARAKLIIPKMNIFSLIESEDYSGAQLVTDGLIADFPGHSYLPAALKEIARRYEKAEQYEEAESVNQQIALQHSASLYGGGAEIKIPTNQIVQLIDAGQMEEAQVAADELVADFNDHPHLPGGLARIASRYYRKASFLLMASHNEPNDQSRNCLREAAAIYETLIERFAVTSNTAGWYRLLGDCHRKLGEYEKAIEYYQKVVSDYSGYQRVYHAQFFIGRCFEALRDSGALPQPEASQLIEQAYKAVVEKYPDCRWFRYTCGELGWLNFRRKQWDQAAEYFELYLSTSPDNEEVSHILYALGWAYEQMGELDLAAGTYSQFIETADPNNRRIEKVQAKLEDWQAQ